MEEINSIFTTQNILIYILIINVITFLIMWFDKHEAKIGDWRVPERTIGFPVILIMQIVCIIYVRKLV